MSAVLKLVPPAREASQEERQKPPFQLLWEMWDEVGRKLVRDGIEQYASFVGEFGYRHLPRYYQSAMKERPFESLYVGQKASAKIVVTKKRIVCFSGANDDWNPLHYDASYAAQTRFGQPIAQGDLGASFISALLANDLPGPGTLYEEKHLTFKAPVSEGDALTTTVEIVAIKPELRQITLSAQVVNQKGTVVTDGTVITRLPRKKKAPS